MSYAEINGARLAYEVLGEGPPLVFVHGFLARGTGTYYAGLKQELARNFRVHALDVRSHGASSAVTEEVTLAKCAQDVTAFADALELSAPLLVGHSMGGFIALSAAIRDASRFSAVVALTPAAARGAPPREDDVAGFMALRNDRELMEGWFASMFVGKASPELLAELRDAALCLPDTIAEAWMRSEWPKSDIAGPLSSLRVPVLTIIGAKDTVVDPSVQYADALCLPEAKILTYTDTGHMLPLERAARCAEEILRFSLCPFP